MTGMNTLVNASSITHNNYVPINFIMIWYKKSTLIIIHELHNQYLFQCLKFLFIFTSPGNSVYFQYSRKPLIILSLDVSRYSQKSLFKATQSLPPSIRMPCGSFLSPIRHIWLSHWIKVRSSPCFWINLVSKIDLLQVYIMTDWVLIWYNKWCIMISMVN